MFVNFERIIFLITLFVGKAWKVNKPFLFWIRYIDTYICIDIYIDRYDRFDIALYGNKLNAWKVIRISSDSRHTNRAKDFTGIIFISTQFAYCRVRVYAIQ